MPTATVQQVLDAAQVRLNDRDVSGGTYASYTALMDGPFPIAYRRLANALQNIGSQRAEREIFILLPAYTTVLVPVLYGLADISEPEFVQERGNIASVVITATDTNLPIGVTTATPHSRATNADVIISGVTGTEAPRGRWFITVTGANTFTLNGSYSDGNAGTGGTVSWASDRFIPVVPVDEIPENLEPLDRLAEYAWEEGRFKFRGAATDRQLRIKYWASGMPPTNVNAVIGWDNAIDFLGAATAAVLAKSKGWRAMAADLELEAYGPDPSRAADGSGGLLRDFLNTIVRSSQRTSRPRAPFRSPRNSRTASWV